MELNIMKNLELDKICRICLAVKKEMRPLFGEMVAEMLMEIAKIQIEQMDGWPDKICIQCIHQVSRCHAFKTRVEKSDSTLRQYIKGITVVVEEHMPKELPIEVSRPQLATQKLPQVQPIQEIHIQRTDIPSIAEAAAPTMILTNAQLLNAGAQIINAGHLLTTAAGQQIIQAPQYHAAQIGQFIQGPNNTIQMITHGAAHPAPLLQIQRTTDDRCEIIVQPDMAEQQFYDDSNVISVNPIQSVPMMVAAPPTAIQHHHLAQHTFQQQQHLHQQMQHQQLGEEQLDDDVEECHIKDGQESEYGEQEDSQIDNDEMIEEDVQEEEEIEAEGEEEFFVTDGDTDDEEKQLAEFMNHQTSCPSPGRYVCNLCRKEFNQPKCLQTHMSSHSNWLKANCKKQPECEICHKSFRGPGMLRMHMKTHEKADKLPTCSICQREFKSKSILYRHRQTHFEKNFACSMCDKRFSSNYQLNIHMQRHKKQKPHKCPHCDKSFYNASDLKVHVNQHLGIKVIQIKKVSTTS
ncbi:zinc finger and BTB domain-containing protein 49 [Wyeomyia smithii]|uniref:zinc finger and BTB domain-containing protein 49 n=1 Tax=Wyeomyia smithii TaxID=174621 RepID=UPI002467E0F0|nr:zinc finger and BTB domain-containing protein 49 [Wyeomyia smithii]XP_055535870.1 zinc finger and BTB domain-containing protein 49 [Wyeomyia smithii]XP_055535871.1 zinc finger and BTB domain-containing protein 49 [Wyeomyia smithii]